MERMDNKTLKTVYGINNARLAKLTGQNANTISRKLRNDQDLTLGAREAGVLACLSVMDDEQRAKVDPAFDAIMAELPPEDD